jgi:hypothetical protein
MLGQIYQKLQTLIHRPEDHKERHELPHHFKVKANNLREPTSTPGDDGMLGAPRKDRKIKNPHSFKGTGHEEHILSLFSLNIYQDSCLILFRLSPIICLGCSKNCNLVCFLRSKGPSTLLVLQPIHTTSKYTDPLAPKPGEQLK